MRITQKTAFSTLFLVLMLFLYMDDASAQSYWDNFRYPVKEKKYSPRFRTGVGMAMLGDKDSQDIYGPGEAVFFDGNYLRFQWAWFGLDLYGRFTFKHFEVKGDEAKPGFGLKAHQMFMADLDAGARAKANFTLLGINWAYYISLAPRFVYTSKMYYEKFTAWYVDEKNLYSPGAVAGTGFEVSLSTHWGLFLEANYGYSAVGKNKADTEGIQFFLGATYLTEIH